MTIKALYPTSRPSLDLNFARTKILDPRITYTRNSTGTFVGSNGLIQSAAVNQARFDHSPLTGESLGLLVEEARTNLELYSEQANQQYNQFGSLSLNSAIAPDGTATADKLITPSGSGAYGLLNYGGTWTAGTPHTFSIYAKKGEWDRIGIRVYDGVAYWIRATVNLTNGQTVSTEAGTLSVQTLSNGWYRVSLTGTPAATQSSYGYNVAVEPHNTALVQNGETGTGTEGIFLWGAQLEAGSFPTSYIPTVASTATRAGEAVSITGANFTNFFNTGAGTFFCEWKSASPSNERILNFGAGSAATVISNEGVMGSGTYFSYLQVFPNSISTNNIKVITTTSVSESAGAYNGNTAVSTGACSYYASATSLDFSPASNGTRVNWYKKVTYWPVRLPNGQLQALTQ